MSVTIEELEAECKARHDIEKKLRKKIHDMSNKMCDLEARIEGLKEANRLKKEHIKKLEEEKITLSRKCQKLQDKVSKDNWTISEYDAENKRFKSEINRLKKELGKRMEIKVKLDEGAFLPVRVHDTDAGADIFTPIDFTVRSGGSATIHTGVHVETPANCVAMLKSKSGLNVNHGIVSEGVIDEGFTGEIVVKLYNHSSVDHRFTVGDKITQLVIIPVLYPTYVEADEISGGERGDNGYGSTGR